MGAFSADTLKKEKASLRRLYEKGYRDRKKIIDFLMEGEPKIWEMMQK